MGISKTEHNLMRIATFHDSDIVADRAMKILRSRYNKTYHWCPGLDYLATTYTPTKEWWCCNCF